MKLTKIHRVLKHLTRWKNISILTLKKRTNAANSFEKYLFKLMIHSAYGKNSGKFTKKN